MSASWRHVAYFARPELVLRTANDVDRVLFLVETMDNALTVPAFGS